MALLVLTLSEETTLKEKREAVSVIDNNVKQLRLANIETAVFVRRSDGEIGVSTNTEITDKIAEVAVELLDECKTAYFFVDNLGEVFVFHNETITDSHELIGRLQNAMIQSYAEITSEGAYIARQLHLLGVLGVPEFSSIQEIEKEIDTLAADEMNASKAISEKHSDLEGRLEFAIQVRELQDGLEDMFDTDITVNQILEADSEEELFTAIFNSVHE